jgi:hypothetical protein
MASRIFLSLGGALTGAPTQQKSPNHSPGYHLKSQNNFPDAFCFSAARQYTTDLQNLRRVNPISPIPFYDTIGLIGEWT